MMLTMMLSSWSARLAQTSVVAVMLPEQECAVAQQRAARRHKHVGVCGRLEADVEGVRGGALAGAGDAGLIDGRSAFDVFCSECALM